MDLFEVGGYYPPPGHEERINRYKENRVLLRGRHDLVFNQNLSSGQQHAVFISTNLPNLVCKKSADFLFGEPPTYSAGKSDESAEQKAIERIVEDNQLNTLSYEAAIGGAARGDSFLKVRWGQKYHGAVSAQSDPFRPFIETQKAEYVFPETLPGDSKTIIAYHVAYPVVVEGTGDQEWELNVESHYPGKIVNRKFRMSVLQTARYTNEVTTWKIEHEYENERSEVLTGIADPLIVHIPNYTNDDECMGIDDITENNSLFHEIDSRLSKISEILDKHSDPAMAVPSGSLEPDIDGRPVFHAGRDKVFEAGKEDLLPQYITWDGQLDAAFKELDVLIDQVLMNSEIPPVALGKENSGTSGSSGLSIKWRMNPILSKVNRKKLYFERGLKTAILLAQQLEHAKLGSAKAGYEITVPKVQFKDGLPDDEREQALIAQIRTAGKPTMSQHTALMSLDGLSEEQATAELARIREEEKHDGYVSSSIFNEVEE